jgi:hypothetical protein
MLALAAAVLLGLRAFGVGEGDPDLLYLGLAFWAAHFCFAIGVPWSGKH